MMKKADRIKLGEELGVDYKKILDLYTISSNLICPDGKIKAIVERKMLVMRDYTIIHLSEERFMPLEKWEEVVKKIGEKITKDYA